MDEFDTLFPCGIFSKPGIVGRAFRNQFTNSENVSAVWKLLLIVCPKVNKFEIPFSEWSAILNRARENVYHLIDQKNQFTKEYAEMIEGKITLLMISLKGSLSGPNLKKLIDILFIVKPSQEIDENLLGIMCAIFTVFKRESVKTTGTARDELLNEEYIYADLYICMDAIRSLLENLDVSLDTLQSNLSAVIDRHLPTCFNPLPLDELPNIQNSIKSFFLAGYKCFFVPIFSIIFAKYPQVDIFYYIESCLLSVKDIVNPEEIPIGGLIRQMGRWQFLVDVPHTESTQQIILKELDTVIDWANRNKDNSGVVGAARGVMTQILNVLDGKSSVEDLIPPDVFLE